MSDCGACARPEVDKPAIFRNDPWCSADCRKVVEARRTPGIVTHEEAREMIFGPHPECDLPGLHGMHTITVGNGLQIICGGRAMVTSPPFAAPPDPPRVSTHRNAQVLRDMGHDV